MLIKTYHYKVVGLTENFLVSLTKFSVTNRGLYGSFRFYVNERKNARSEMLFVKQCETRS